MKVRFSYILLFGFFAVFVSCEAEPKKKALPFESRQEYEEINIYSHQLFLKKEKEKIQNYIDSSHLDFQKTGTGLHYVILDSSNGDTFKTGDIAVIRYQLKSIEGKLLYETRPELAQEFAVDYDDVETGLHEAIKKMKVGERAIIILPAHLAFGITGDQAAIPSQTTLVYYLSIVGKK
ncbi:MAG: FKBP-type peptidyl-prolyl cis-trans isomerase [Flavobacteriales bacterium]|nr:FKBP-type peptidyl-prolyl cis-trans isomerase [Flavobacteriales bacterium]